jgi:hypothetical protein
VTQKTEKPGDNGIGADLFIAWMSDLRGNRYGLACNDRAITALLQRLKAA